MNDTTVTQLKMPVSAIINGIDEMNIPEVTMETRIATVHGGKHYADAAASPRSPGLTINSRRDQPSSVHGPIKVSSNQQRDTEEKDAVSVEDATALPFLDGPDSAAVARSKDRTPEILQHSVGKRYDQPSDII